MTAKNRWLALTIVSAALFLIVIDVTVLYTALPTLVIELGASQAQKLWILNAYPLVVAALLPGLGTLGDRIGHRRIFLAGLVVFGIASAAAAFSPTPAILIAARVVLAVGAAMMMPATLSLIRLIFTDDRERALAIGIWAGIASGGAALGPVIGGVLLEFFWWGSVFLINIPVVLAALVFGVIFLPDAQGDRSKAWDLVGSLQIMVALFGLVFAIKETGAATPDPVRAVVALIAGGIALWLFIARQRRSAAPLIAFDLFGDRRFSGGVIAALVASAALLGIELLYSQRLQLVLGHSPLSAGMLMLPISLSALFAAPLAGILLPRIGNGRLLWSMLLLAGLAMLGFRLTFEGPQIVWLACLAVAGFAIGATMTAASTAIMVAAPPERAGMAASVEEVSYELGGVIGIAVLTTVMSLIYTRTMTQGDMLPAAREGLEQALMVASRIDPASGDLLAATARAAFDSAFAGAVGLLSVVVIVAALLLTRRDRIARLGQRSPA